MADSENPYLEDPDVQLMLRVKEGDEAAFAKLVTNYQNRLLGLITNFLGNESAAEDVVQEAFLRVYRVRVGYQPTAKFSTWLIQIAHNLASNWLRTKGRRKEVHLKSEESGPMEVPPQNSGGLADKSSMMPTRQLDQREVRRRVQEALETLNERQKLAVLLHRFEEMSYAEIGDIMEMTPVAVKSLLGRARENLRLALEPIVK